MKLAADILTPDGTRTGTADAVCEAAKTGREQQVGVGEQLLSFRRIDC